MQNGDNKKNEITTILRYAEFEMKKWQLITKRYSLITKKQQLSIISIFYVFFEDNEKKSKEVFSPSITKKIYILFLTHIYLNIYNPK